MANTERYETVVRLNTEQAKKEISELSMGYIHISRVEARHKCIHLSVGKCLGWVSAMPAGTTRDRLS